MAKIKSDYISWTLQLKADGVQKEIHNITEANQELKESNKSLRKEMRDLEKQGKAGTAEYKNLNNELKKNNAIVRENGEKLKLLESRLDKTNMSAAQLEKAAKRLRTELRNTVKNLEPEKYRALQKELNEVEKAMGKASKGSSGLGVSLRSLDKITEIIRGTLWSLGLIITGQIVDTFKNAINVIIDFEAENSKLAAVLGTTKAEIKDLTDQAKELGATTSYTASEVTKLQIELAKLGFAKDQITAMTPEVLKFAKAVDTDLASAAALAGSALRIFERDAEDAGELLATMAVGTTKSALSFTYLQSALSTVGPVANAFGFTIEETTALLGALANSGFDASSAATATRNIMLNMADSSGKLAKALGAPVKNLDDLVNGLQKLEKDGVNLAEALELTDKRSVAAFQTFLKGGQTLTDLRNSVTDCTEAFDGMVDEMSDNVRGSLNILQSTLEGVVLRFYESRGAIRAMIDGVTWLINGIGKLIDFINKYSLYTYTLLAAVTAYTVAVKINIVELYNKVKASVAAAAADRAHAVSLMQATTGCSKLTARLRILYATLTKHPYALVAAAIVAVIVALTQWNKKAKETETIQNRLSRLSAQAEKDAQGDLSRAKRLYKATQDQNTKMSERIKLVDQLKKQYPGYFDKLTTEEILAGKASKAYKQLTKDIIASAKARVYEKEIEKLEQENYKDQRGVNADTNYINRNKRKYEVRKDRYERLGIYGGDNLIGDYEDRQDRLEQGLKRIEERNKTIAALAKKVLESQPTSDAGDGGGGGGNRFDDKKDKKSPTDKKLKELKAEHDQRMALIAQQGREENKLQSEIELEKVKENERYATARLEAIKELGEKTAAANKKELTKQKEAAAKAATDLIAAQDDMEDTLLAREKEHRDKRIALENAYYQQQKASMDQALQNGKITKGQHNAYMLEVEQAHSSQMAQIARDYQECVAGIDIYGNEKREKIQKEANDAVIAADNNLLAARARTIQKIREMEQANPIGLAGMTQQRDRMIADVQASYDAMIQIAQQAGLDTVELERQKQAEISQINYEYQEQVYQLQQELGVTWAQEYDNELAKYKQLLNQEYISEEQFQKKKLQLQTKNVKKYFDYYSGLSSSMVDAIQQYEMDAVDAKYDVLIREAENNGEDTAELEEQKENEKLEIQKKYADVNFAVKCSQIIADTAVSIMMAYSQLGPIAGSVAAALMGATGAMQLASAKAERDKIKNMQPSRSSGSSSSSQKSTPTASRTVKSGYADGGYTGDGGRYEVAGYVHKGEYVVPQPIMDDPRVVDAVGTIEAIRRQRSNNNPMPGYADGGPVGDQPDTPAPGALGTREIREAARDIKEAAASIRKVKAYIVYQDFEKSKETIDNARDVFTRNKE